MAAHSVTVDEMAKHAHYGSAKKDNKGFSRTDPGDGRFKFNMDIICSDKYERSDNPPVWNWWCITTQAGNDQAHNNLQPSKGVYIWARTA